VPLSAIADIRVVEGPAMIKSENGMLRSYVQLNVRDRDLMGFVAEARERVERGVKLPPGMFIEWGGQFEHQVRARDTLRIIFPLVLLLILVILYVVYSDWAHALLMMLAVPGALAGGVIFQWLFGYNFSVAVWVGYIACFGMAAENGIIMLAYMREAIAERGGLAAFRTVEELRDAIVVGSVHRQRPKLLTEATAIIGLAPMLWATGVGAEIMRPMAAPIMGGLLISDEMIDTLPNLHQVEKRRWPAASADGGWRRGRVAPRKPLNLIPGGHRMKTPSPWLHHHLAPGPSLRHLGARRGRAKNSRPSARHGRQDRQDAFCRSQGIARLLLLPRGVRRQVQGRPRQVPRQDEGRRRRTREDAGIG
jgi:hypothetical protein